MGSSRGRLKELSRSARARTDASPDRYAAFISYSHAVDGQLAPALQGGLQRFAKPWNRVRALRVFRDETSLSADPALWAAIEGALSASSAFILMASPEAARSPWVAKEVAWWCSNKEVSRMLVGVTGGEVAWNEAVGDFDWGATSALPHALQGVFQAEPKWVDLRWARDEKDVSLRHPRFRQCVADLAAPLHGRPRDELIGEDISAHRRAMRLARSAIAVLVCLTLLAVTGAVIAVGQRNRARDQTRLAMARQVAALAISNLDGRLDLAQLLAVQGFQLRRTAQTEAALFQAAAASPHLVRFLAQGEGVTATAVAADGTRFASGGVGGSVIVWDAATGAGQHLGPLGGRVTAVAFDRTGAWLAAATADQVLVHDLAAGASVAAIAAGQPVQAVAVDRATESLVVLHSSGQVSVREARTGREVASGGSLPEAEGLAFGADQRTVVVTASTGMVLRLSRADLTPVGSPTIMLTPASGSTGAFSDDGTFYGFAKAGTVSVHKPGEDFSADKDFPQVVSRQAEAFAVSPSGERAAVASGGVISILDASGSRLRQPITTRLTGSSRVDRMQFLGGADKLVSVEGETLALWDLRVPAALGQDLGVDIPDIATVVNPAESAVRPDGQQLAWLQENGRLVLRDLRSNDQAVAFMTASQMRVLAFRGDSAVLAVAGNSGGELWDVRGQPPSRIGAWRTDTGAVALGFLSDDELAQVSSRGIVTVVGVPSGEVRRTFPTAESAISLSPRAAAISVSGRFAAMAGGDRGLVVVDLDTGGVRDGPALPGGALHLALTRADTVLVEDGEGQLTEWDPATGRTTARGGAEGGYIRVGVTADARLIVGLKSTGAIVLWSRATGERLGEVAVPPSIDLASAGDGFQTGWAFSPDGTALFTTTAGGSAVRWDLTADGWAAAACRRAGRSLTPAEWRALVGSQPPGDLACRL